MLRLQILEAFLGGILGLVGDIQVVDCPDFTLIEQGIL